MEVAYEWDLDKAEANLIKARYVILLETAVAPLFS
jgi:hypothetical protein